MGRDSQVFSPCRRWRRRRRRCRLRSCQLAMRAPPKREFRQVLVPLYVSISPPSSFPPPSLHPPPRRRSQSVSPSLYPLLILEALLLFFVLSHRTHTHMPAAILLYLEIIYALAATGILESTLHAALRCDGQVPWFLPIGKFNSVVVRPTAFPETVAL